MGGQQEALTAGTITAVAGIEVGHAGDEIALTGSTVVLARNGAVLGVDVRGSAPGTRETDLCRPGTLFERGHAILLTGGSAFGLDAASGVMRYLREQGIGFVAGGFRIPIVPGAVIFDLGIGEPRSPGAETGYAACVAASSDPPTEGSVGAGLGATVGKVLGVSKSMKAGIGTACVEVGAVRVGAIVCVNAFGTVVDPASGRAVAGPRDPESGEILDTIDVLLHLPAREAGPTNTTNTTIGVIALDCALDSAAVNHLASVAHTGLARTIHPVQTSVDGDTFFGLATCASDEPPPPMVVLEAAVVRAVEEAVLRAVRTAVAAGGLPAAVSLD